MRNNIELAGAAHACEMRAQAHAVVCAIFSFTKIPTLMVVARHGIACKLASLQHVEGLRRA